MKRRVILSLLLFFCLLAPLRLGSCSANPIYQISEEQLTELEAHLTALEMNNSELMILLNESNSDLTIAQESLKESRYQIVTLKKQLQALKKESEAARKSLEIANIELQKASESFKRYEQERDEIEGRLRTQRGAWQAIAAVLAGICIAQ